MPTIDNRESQIENLRPWVESETGMTFSGDKFSRLRSAVEKVLRRSGDRIEADFEQILAHPQRRSLFLERLAAELTIGESFFFRNEHHFRALREHIIPAILAENAEHNEIRIWSAGCAGGEEPYSVAILLDQLLQQQSQIGNWTVHIVGTDLNGEFLEKARTGRYRQWSFRQTDINNNREYFSREGSEYLLVPRVRQLVRFAYLNLVKDVYPSPRSGTFGLDLILFRNVAIYFRPEVTKAIIQRFHRALRPGGWLLLGETEVIGIPSAGFAVHRFGDATLFRKGPERGAVRDESWPMPTPPLAAIHQQPSAQAAVQHPLPDWIPVPKAAKVTAPIETSSTADQIQRFLQQRNFAAAERMIDRIPGGTDRATARLQYVHALLACAEVRRAREMLDQCLDEEPLLIESQLLKAAFAEEDGDLRQAEQAYRRALFVDRKCSIAHFHLALVQKQTGDLAGARRSLRIAADLARGKDVHEAVPHGEGVCYGRLLEMIEGD